MTQQLRAGNVPVLLSHEPRLRTTSLCLALGFGGRHDPPGAEGTAHLFEHLVMSRPLDGGAPLCERVERAGGSVNARTGPETLLIHAQVLAEDAPQTLEWMSRALLDFQLTQDCLDSERQVVLQEIAAAVADPADTVQDAFLAALFAGHPLGSPVAGDPVSVGTITLDRLHRAHADAMAASPVAVAAVGGTDPDALQRALTRTGLDTLPAPTVLGGGAGTGAAAPGPVHPTTVTAWPDDFTWLMAGGRAPSAGDPRRHAYNVLAHLLGASPASLLYARLRNKEALAYDFRSWARNYSDAGAWRMLAGTEPGNAPRLLDAFQEILHTVAAEGPSDEALAAAVHQAVVDTVLEAEAPLDLAMSLASQRVLVEHPWDPDQDIEALCEVTAQQVTTAAAELADGLVCVVRPQAA
ncbi:M16 family metallopeptidase [Streptacidiphilus neutrinimicus]|uniref:M16 family metallopeptidase n=1 Tax=Streptacidiphilus neutrinimicus TaxID=105420 RepID=UPI0005A98D44|nr:pitrilysin family protein [Streptacidiphilus neutrinimicus]